LLTDDDTADVLLDMLAARREDGDVHLLIPPADLQFEVGFHVIDRDPILVKKRPPDTLAYLLFRIIFNGLARDVVEEFAFLNGGNTLRVFQSVNHAWVSPRPVHQRTPPHHRREPR